MRVEDRSVAKCGGGAEGRRRDDLNGVAEETHVIGNHVRARLGAMTHREGVRRGGERSQFDEKHAIAGENREGVVRSAADTRGAALISTAAGEDVVTGAERFEKAGLQRAGKIKA